MGGFFFRYILFVNGFSDILEEILIRIGSGKFIFSGGNWNIVLEIVKVSL